MAKLKSVSSCVGIAFLVGASSLVLLKKDLAVESEVNEASNMKSPPIVSLSFERTLNVGEMDVKFSSPEFVSVSPSFTQRFAFGEDSGIERQFVVLNEDAYGVESRYAYSTSFDIVDVCAQKRDVFFAVGQASNGDYVIEKWKHKLLAGMPGGGSPDYRLIRTELYRGASLGTVVMLGADPNGGYLLIIHGQGLVTVSQLDLQSPGNPIVQLYTESTIPQLGYGVHGIRRLQHQLEGLVWMIGTLDAPYVGGAIVLRDQTLDGVIDSFSEYDNQSLNSAYPLSPVDPVWVSNFISN